ncbi:hypothetical protein AB4030_19930 [Terrabacter sp. 2YAF2]
MPAAKTFDDATRIRAAQHYRDRLEEHGEATIGDACAHASGDRA